MLPCAYSWRARNIQDPASASGHHRGEHPQVRLPLETAPSTVANTVLLSQPASVATSFPKPRLRMGPWSTARAFRVDGHQTSSGGLAWRRESRQVVWHKKHPDESHRGVRIRCSVDTSRLVSELDFLTFRNLWLLEEDLEADSREQCQNSWDNKDHRPVDDGDFRRDRRQSI